MSDLVEDADPEAYYNNQLRRIEEIAARTEQTLLAYEASGRASHQTTISSLATYQAPMKSTPQLSPGKRKKVRELLKHASMMAESTKNLNIKTDFSPHRSYNDPHAWVGFCVAGSACCIVLVFIIILLVIIF